MLLPKETAQILWAPIDVQLLKSTNSLTKQLFFASSSTQSNFEG